MKKLTDKVTFKNGATITSRTAQSPMLTNSGVNEMVSESTLEYYSARSNSAGMVIVEYTNVSLNGGPSRSWPDHEQLAIYDDKFIPGLTKVATALKKEGNKALLQICHAGREANYAHALGRVAAVPSKVEMPWIDYPLHVLEENEVWEIVKDFGSATKRAIECGFDGIEIHGANHYLLQQFFSDFSNKRNDYWGGTLEKKMNFAMEVSKEVFRVVKEYAPENFIVGYRISPDEIHGSNVGYTWRESQQLVKKLVDTYDFDYIHISLLQYDAKPEDNDLTYCEIIRDVLPEDTKLLVAGGISTYEKMNDALNYVDVIAMGRATLIDPEIGYKLLNNKQDEIYLEFNEESVSKAYLPEGIISLVAQVPEFEMPGNEYLKSLIAVELGDQFTHTGNEVIE